MTYDVPAVPPGRAAAPFDASVVRGSPPQWSRRVVASPRSDDQLAGNLATETGRLLLAVRQQGRHGRRRAGTLAVRTAVGYMTAALAAARPGDRVLHRDVHDDGGPAGGDRIWIVEPLDGERSFLSPGSDDWAVHVALWDRGAVTAAAVAFPARRLTYSCADAPALAGRGAGGLRLAVDPDRPADLAGWLSRRLDADLVGTASAAGATIAVVMGQVDAYLDPGGGDDWRWVAPSALARACGVHALSTDGATLSVEPAWARSPGMVLCRPELVPELAAALTAAQPARRERDDGDLARWPEAVVAAVEVAACGDARREPGWTSAG